MKANHDTQMVQVEFQLEKARNQLNESVRLHDDAENKLEEEKQIMANMTKERARLENRTNNLNEKIKLVEEKVLNLTSKLLSKEVEAGIEKEENKRLLETIENLKKKAADDQTVKDLINIEKASENHTKSNESESKDSEKVEKSKVDIAVNESQAASEDIVEKIVKLKSKEKELKDAKENLISSIDEEKSSGKDGEEKREKEEKDIRDDSNKKDEPFNKNEDLLNMVQFKSEKSNVGKDDNIMKQISEDTFNTTNKDVNRQIEDNKQEPIDSNVKTEDIIEKAVKLKHKEEELKNAKAELLSTLDSTDTEKDDKGKKDG